MALSRRLLALAKTPKRSFATDARYKAKEFPNLAKLQGISQDTLNVHQKLYQGYVANTNTLLNKLSEFRQGGSAAPTNPAYAEISRRLGWEYNGMILHELYFGNMVEKGTKLSKNSNLHKAIVNSFGSYEAWEKDFKATAALRGIGWAILYKDPSSGFVSTHWITEHEMGHPAGYKPILVLDIWEHAFIRDYVPADRPKYIDAFMSQIDWEVASKRFDA